MRNLDLRIRLYKLLAGVFSAFSCFAVLVGLGGTFSAALIGLSSTLELRLAVDAAKYICLVSIGATLGAAILHTVFAGMAVNLQAKKARG